MDGAGVFSRSSCQGGLRPTGGDKSCLASGTGRGPTRLIWPAARSTAGATRRGRSGAAPPPPLSPGGRRRGELVAVGRVAGVQVGHRPQLALGVAVHSAELHHVELDAASVRPRWRNSTGPARADAGRTSRTLTVARWLGWCWHRRRGSRAGIHAGVARTPSAGRRRTATTRTRRPACTEDESIEYPSFSCLRAASHAQSRGATNLVGGHS